MGGAVGGGIEGEVELTAVEGVINRAGSKRVVEYNGQ